MSNYYAEKVDAFWQCPHCFGEIHGLEGEQSHAEVSEDEREALADIVQEWDEPGHRREVYLEVAESIQRRGFRLAPAVSAEDAERVEKLIAEAKRFADSRERDGQRSAASLVRRLVAELEGRGE